MFFTKLVHAVHALVGTGLITIFSNETAPEKIEKSCYIYTVKNREELFNSNLEKIIR